MAGAGRDRPRVMITGGVRRVGLAIARAFASAGCDLVLTYRTSHNDAQRVSLELSQTHGCVVRLERVDLADAREVEQLADRLRGTLDRLDVLVHNASVYAASPTAEITADIATNHYRVNALAPLLLSSRLSPLLADSTLPGGGAIVAMTDIHAGIGSGDSLPRRDFSAYAMSKAALAEMVRTLAVALAPNVRVNAVAPGVVAWPERGYESDEAAQRAYLSRVPMGRAGTPEDAAEAVRWLALDAAYTTGHTLRIDGGRSLR